MWWTAIAGCAGTGSVTVDQGTSANDADADTDVDTDTDTSPPIDTASYGPQPEDPGLAATRYAAMFDPAVLHTVDISFTDANFALLQANGLVAVPGRLTIDGDAAPYAISVKMGGDSAQFGWSVKGKLHLDFDDYVPDQTFGGMEKLTLDDLFDDPAMANGVIASEVLIAGNLPSARAAFATVTVQGVAAGLYAIDEEIDRHWLARWFPDTTGVLWECLDGCDFTDPGLPYWVGTGDRAPLDAIQSVVQTDFVDFYPALGALVQTDQLVGMWAWLAVLGHDNSWPYDLKNSWAYADPTQTGLLTFIPDNVDRAFNPFTGYDQVGSLLGARCLYDAQCKADLIAAINVRADAFDEMDVPGLAQAALDLTDAAVTADPARNPAVVHDARAALAAQIAVQSAQVRGELQ